MVEADLHAEYGVDLGDEATLARPWSWARLRILQLLQTPPAQYVRVEEGKRYRLVPTWRTRLQHTLTPPKFDSA